MLRSLKDLNSDQGQGLASLPHYLLNLFTSSVLFHCLVLLLPPTPTPLLCSSWIKLSMISTQLLLHLLQIVPPSRTGEAFPSLFKTAHHIYLCQPTILPLFTYTEPWTPGQEGLLNSLPCFTSAKNPTLLALMGLYVLSLVNDWYLLHRRMSSSCW